MKHSLDPKNKLVGVSFRLDPKQKKAIKRLAKRLGKTESHMVRVALDMYFYHMGIIV